MSKLIEFIEAEDGVVMVDWVVLSAGVVGLGIATLAVLSGGVEGVSRDIDNELIGIETSGSF